MNLFKQPYKIQAVRWKNLKVLDRKQHSSTYIDTPADHREHGAEVNLNGYILDSDMVIQTTFVKNDVKSTINLGLFSYLSIIHKTVLKINLENYFEKFLKQL